MGQTAHLALAFDPTDKAKVIAMLNDDESDVGDIDCIRSQPDFDLWREDNYEVHRLLEVLAEGNPELAALGTIVQGSHPVAEAGMGIQYFYSTEVLRTMAEAYRHVTSDTLVAAIEKIRPEFDPRSFEFIPAVIPEKFAIIRRELSFVADKGWAMIAGMF